MNARARIMALILFLLLPAAADAGGGVSISVSATVLSQNKCRFSTKTGAVDFGVLVPGSGTNYSVTTLLDIICVGNQDPATFFISDDAGLNESGTTKRMSNGAASYINYSMTYIPITGTIPKNTTQTVTVTTTLQGPAYVGAPPGVYSDTVTLTILP